MPLKMVLPVTLKHKKMFVNKNISIPLNHIQKDLVLKIFPEGKSKLYQIDEAEANMFGEVPYQISESKSYEYEFSDLAYRLSCDIENIVNQSHREKHTGRVNPSFFVGTLKLIVRHKDRPKENFTAVEVIATKFNSDDRELSYRENYRFMLEEITEKCTELLLQINSPIQQHLKTDFNKDSESLYQQFSFINSIIGSKEFEEAIQKIVSNPKTNWAEDQELIDIRRVRKFTRNAVKQLANRGNRMSLQKDYPLYESGITSLPSKIINNKKKEVIDNAENRFIKHALQTYHHFTENCANIFENGTRAFKEAVFLTNKLERFLNQQFFKEISRPTSLNFNSPVLQRKSGYREILKSWLKFDLAAKLIWSGGEDVYKAGKRDISKLYEYWLFFKLYDLFKHKFLFNTIEHENELVKSLIQKTEKGLNFIIKSGKHTALSGMSKFRNRNLNVKFSYNQTFSGNKKYKDNVKGSYTKSMYPDYTLSFWPSEVGDEKEAEKKELIVHIHFDAKYKVNYKDEFNASRKDEEESERKGNYKNVDLFKMHAYKDAIRRTGGAYILYPGNSATIPMRGFHEIIPGLGAFAIRPSENNNGLKALSDFIDKVLVHLLDRSSQRENLSTKIYDIHKNNKPDQDVLREMIPEYIYDKKLIPDETYVLIGFYKSKEHLDWILEKQWYNFRTGLGMGSKNLNEQDVNAKYLVLHGHNELVTSKIYRLSSEGVKIFSKEDLKKLKYPSAPKGKAYIMFKIEDEVSDIFNNLKWNLRMINKFESKRQSAKPYTISLKELMDTKIDNTASKNY